MQLDKFTLCTIADSVERLEADRLFISTERRSTGLSCVPFANVYIFKGLG